MSAINKLNTFVDSKIEPIKVSKTEIVSALDVCDWLIQKYGKLTYTSFPDKQSHTVL